ncbi:hypothetical protein SAMN02745134_03890 [Clostridium acidisoli DSM 12555]|uniref:Uncharacterized protein n=1 Tax=Clostridium acidisoli DSM 12555 TaxID=1121291 RepID=A0A1W1XZN2_9CLOT|nr:hypothetical protein [Clostridium acidisoli]SMC29420.1 hypothetical protein SAMN02745134_03890 [Clostridium acidisoli DSM 12555]
MNKFEVTIKKNQEQCLNMIKKAIHDYYSPLGMDNSGKIITYKYLCKIKNGNISIISRGIAYVPVLCKIKLSNNNEDETKIIGTFNKSIFSRLFIWIIAIVGTLGSIVFIIGMVFFENSISIRERVINAILAILLIVVFMAFLLYSEKTRTKEKKKIIGLLNDIFNIDS